MEFEKLTLKLKSPLRFLLPLIYLAVGIYFLLFIVYSEIEYINIFLNLEQGYAYEDYYAYVSEWATVSLVIFPVYIFFSALLLTLAAWRWPKE